MPRKLKSKASTGPKAVKRRRRWKVRREPVKGAQLIEVGPEHGFWKGHAGALHKPQAMRGAIVKLTPPPGTEESLVLALERMFYEGGCATVKVMPVQDELKVTVEGEEFDFTEDDERTLRQVALERCERVANARDMGALRDLVNQAMDEGENQ